MDIEKRFTAKYSNARAESESVGRGEGGSYDEHAEIEKTVWNWIFSLIEKGG